MIFHIAELLDEVASHLDLPADLKRFSRVSSSCTRPAHRQLFKTVRIVVRARGRGRTNGTDNVLDTPRLANHVRSLYIVGLCRQQPRDRCDMDFVWQKVRACHGVREVHLEEVKWVASRSLDLTSMTLPANLTRVFVKDVTVASGSPLDILLLKDHWEEVNLCRCSPSALETEADLIRTPRTDRLVLGTRFVHDNPILPDRTPILSGCRELTITHDMVSTETVALFLEAANWLPGVKTLHVIDQWHHHYPLVDCPREHVELADAIRLCTGLSTCNIRIPYVRAPQFAARHGSTYDEIAVLLGGIPDAVTRLELKITHLPSWYPCVPFLDIMFSLIGWDIFERAIFQRSRPMLRELTVVLDTTWFEPGWMEDRMLHILLRVFCDHFSRGEVLQEHRGFRLYVAKGVSTEYRQISASTPAE